MRLSLTILAAIFVNLVALLVPGYVSGQAGMSVEALLRTQEQGECWALTRVLEGPAGVSEERYLSWAPAGTRWQLVGLNGETPTAEQSKDYQGGPEISLAVLAELVRQKELIVEESDVFVVYHFQLSSREALVLGSDTALTGTISVRKATGLVASVALRGDRIGGEGSGSLW